jgi:hypothetical protein
MLSTVATDIRYQPNFSSSISPRITLIPRIEEIISIWLLESSTFEVKEINFIIAWISAKSAGATAEIRLKQKAPRRATRG